MNQYKYELFHIYFTSLYCTGKYELNQLTSLPMCGFIAQLVEHRTGIAEVTGSNPVEALIFFSGFFFPIDLLQLRWKLNQRMWWTFLRFFPSEEEIEKERLRTEKNFLKGYLPINLLFSGNLVSYAAIIRVAT